MKKHVKERKHRAKCSYLHSRSNAILSRSNAILKRLLEECNLDRDFGGYMGEPVCPDFYQNLANIMRSAFELRRAAKRRILADSKEKHT